MSRAYRTMFAGSRADVLIEEIENIDGKPYFMGFTPNYIRVRIPCEEPEVYAKQRTSDDFQGYVNTIVNVTLTGLTDNGIVMQGTVRN